MNRPEVTIAAEKPRLEELLDVRRSPDLAFQSYECFASNAAARKVAEEEFVREERDDIPLEYTKMPNEDQMLQRIAVLDVVLSRVDEIEDTFVREVTFSSVAFRQAEMYFTLTAARLSRLVGAYNFIKENRPDEQELAALKKKIIDEAERYRECNALLYGEPDRQEHDQALGEVWAMIDAKTPTLHPEAAILRDELAHGFVARHRDMAPFPKSDKRLPTLSLRAKEWVKDFIMSEYSEYYGMVKAHWDDVILPRSQANGVDPEFDVKLDMIPLFERSIMMSDPEELAGIRVIENPDSMSLAWDTPSASVICGTAPRTVPIDSPEKAFGKMYHEHFGGHGKRMVDGLQTGIPIAGYGVFTLDPESSETGDYITYEEGQNKIVESVLCSDGEKEWSVSDLWYTLGIGMAMFEGRDTAEIYEVLWRLKVLEGLKSNEAPSEQKIQKAKAAAAKAIGRFERSRPPHLPDFAGKIVFTKDLMYLRGRCRATPAVEEWAGRDDRESFRNAHTMKTDPTDRVQYELMKRAGRPVQLERFDNAA